MVVRVAIVLGKATTLFPNMETVLIKALVLWFWVVCRIPASNVVLRLVSVSIVEKLATTSPSVINCMGEKMYSHFLMVSHLETVVSHVGVVLGSHVVEVSNSSSSSSD